MSRLFTGVFDVVKEECCTVILCGYMNPSSLLVYAQYIKDSKIGRRGRDSKRGRSDAQGQPRFMKRSPGQDVPSTPKPTIREENIVKLINLLSKIAGRNILGSVYKN